MSKEIHIQFSQLQCNKLKDPTCF